MNDPIHFTDREQFVLSYYRDPALSRWQRFVMLQGVLVAVSLGLLVLGIIQQDWTWVLVAYVLLLWRTCAAVWRARLFVDSFRSIISKYDAKIVELSERGA